MSEFVLDCSMTMTWCFADEATARTDELRDRLLKHAAVVPRVLWDLEVWNALLVAWRRGRIRELEANARSLMALPVRRLSAPLERALELGAKHALSSYDALYLGLALREGLPLACRDGALTRAAFLEGVEVLPA